MIMQVVGGIGVLALLTAFGFILWLIAPRFPDLRINPVVLAVKIWLSKDRNDSSFAEDLSIPDPLDELDRRMRSFARVIEAPFELLPVRRGADFGCAMVEHDGTRYYYLYVERGERYDEKYSENISDVLYWTFVDVTWALASEYERTHRDPRTGDFRRLLFSHQLKLLYKLSPDWAAHRKEKIDETLRADPYMDNRAGENG